MVPGWAAASGKCKFLGSHTRPTGSVALKNGVHQCFTKPSRYMLKFEKHCSGEMFWKVWAARLRDLGKLLKLLDKELFCFTQKGRRVYISFSILQWALVIKIKSHWEENKSWPVWPTLLLLNSAFSFYKINELLCGLFPFEEWNDGVVESVSVVFDCMSPWTKGTQRIYLRGDLDKQFWYLLRKLSRRFLLGLSCNQERAKRDRK